MAVSSAVTEDETNDNRYDLRLENKKAVEGLTKCYLDFRMKKIKKENGFLNRYRLLTG